MYNFYLDREHPGYFAMCIKPGFHAKHIQWPVKIVPGAFELRGNEYPDMRALKNGFKTLWEVEKTRSRNRQQGYGGAHGHGGPQQQALNGHGYVHGHGGQMVQGMGRRY